MSGAELEDLEGVFSLFGDWDLSLDLTGLSFLLADFETSCLSMLDFLFFFLDDLVGLGEASLDFFLVFSAFLFGERETSRPNISFLPRFSSGDFDKAEALPSDALSFLLSRFCFDDSSGLSGLGELLRDFFFFLSLPSELLFLFFLPDDEGFGEALLDLICLTSSFFSDPDLPVFRSGDVVGLPDPVVLEDFLLTLPDDNTGLGDLL